VSAGEGTQVLLRHFHDVTRVRVIAADVDTPAALVTQGNGQMVFVIGASSTPDDIADALDALLARLQVTQL
jgi:hypothetical protein